VDDWAYVRREWGDDYRLHWSGDRCVAFARFHPYDVLDAATPNELLEKIRRHHPGFPRLRAVPDVTPTDQARDRER
jgi:hypothetical protein